MMSSQRAVPVVWLDRADTRRNGLQTLGLPIFLLVQHEKRFLSSSYDGETGLRGARLACKAGYGAG
jgi:hypothetical protein